MSGYNPYSTEGSDSDSSSESEDENVPIQNEVRYVIEEKITEENKVATPQGNDSEDQGGRGKRSYHMRT